MRSKREPEYICKEKQCIETVYLSVLTDERRRVDPKVR